MHAIDYRRFVAATIVTLLAFLPGSLCARVTERPNVLVIVADDLGYADLAFLSHAPADVKRIGTPALDRLAQSGTYFADAYSTSPICSPSRCGLITGRYQQRWGNYWYGEGGLPRTEKTLPQMLEPLDYRAVKVGKTHLNGGPVEHPLDHGFDQYLGFIHHTWDYLRLSQRDLDAYKQRAAGQRLGILCVGPLLRDRDPASFEDAFTTELFTDEAIEVLRDQQPEKPFYIQLEYNAVHMPTYIAHPDYAAQIGFEQPAWDREADAWEFPYWDPRKEPWSQWHSKWGHLGAVDPLGRKRYLSHLLALDHEIGRILDVLDETGQRENTVVVFLSDNGGTINTYSNNTPLRGYKYMFGEGGIRIPMIVSYPGKLPGGKTCSKLVSAMDIVPTLLELVGGTAPEDLDGRSLLPLICGEQEEENHSALCWSNGKDTWVIRSGPWKLTYNAGWTHENYQLEDGIAIRDPEPYVYPDGVQLFNLRDDIGETKNLANEYPEIVQRLTESYQQWRSEMSDPRTGEGKLKRRKTN